jgi:hypothetical protein
MKAFGRCVSRIATQKAERKGQDSADSHDENSGGAHEKDGANPAKTCKALQADDRAHFQTTYGTRPNAFGQCVAKQARAENG